MMYVQPFPLQPSELQYPLRRQPQPPTRTSQPLLGLVRDLDWPVNDLKISTLVIDIRQCVPLAVRQ